MEPLLLPPESILKSPNNPSSAPDTHTDLSLLKLMHPADRSQVVVRSALVSNTVAEDRRLSAKQSSSDSAGRLFEQDNAASREANDAMRVLASTAGITMSTFAGKAHGCPYPWELAALARRYPDSQWNHPSWFGKSLISTRVQLDNVASWGSQATGYPEANKLRGEVERRGMRSGLYSALGGTAINHVLDKTFFSESKYGLATTLFDGVGVAFIAAMPQLPFPVKIAGIVAGHYVARQFDNSPSTRTLF